MQAAQRAVVSTAGRASVGCCCRSSRLAVHFSTAPAALPTGSVRLGQYTLPDDLRPTKQANGKWFKPALSARNAAALRKRTILATAAGVPGVVPWDGAWGRQLKAVHMRPPKQTRHDLRIFDT